MKQFETNNPAVWRCNIWTPLLLNQSLLSGHTSLPVRVGLSLYRGWQSNQRTCIPHTYLQLYSTHKLTSKLNTNKYIYFLNVKSICKWNIIGHEKQEIVFIQKLLHHLHLFSTIRCEKSKYFLSFHKISS